VTFDSQLCEELLVALGRKHTLRHAYRIYLWRSVRGLVEHSYPDEVARAGTDICSLIQASAPSSDGPNRSGVRVHSWRI
jgi:hypothetical protein